MLNNKQKFFLIFILGLIIGALAIVLFISYTSYSSQIFAPVSAFAFFSPENGKELLSFIDSAKQSIDVEIYVFTSDDALQALKRASDRGVAIRVIIEKRVSNDDNWKIFNDLKVYGIKVKWASIDYALTHAKFVIVDGKRVLVGSHNFSQHAMYKNREAGVILTGEKIANDFQQVFEEDWIKAN